MSSGTGNWRIIPCASKSNSYKTCLSLLEQGAICGLSPFSSTHTLFSFPSCSKNDTHISSPVTISNSHLSLQCSYIFNNFVAILPHSCFYWLDSKWDDSSNTNLFEFQFLFQNGENWPQMKATYVGWLLHHAACILADWVLMAVRSSLLWTFKGQPEHGSSSAICLLSLNQANHHLTMVG